MGTYNKRLSFWCFFIVDVVVSPIQVSMLSSTPVDNTLVKLPKNLALADVVHEAQKPCWLDFGNNNLSNLYINY